MAEGFEPARPPRSLAEVLVESALLHATRAAIFRDQNFIRPRLLPRPGELVQRLRHGQASHRVRFAALLVRRTARALREEGAGGTLRLVRSHLGGAPTRDVAAAAAAAAGDPYATALPEPASARLARRVLIVAELSIPQCAKYRVWQRQEQIEALGVGCTVVDWRLPIEARSALQVHTDLILYRVPAERSNLALLVEARRLGVPSFWEVDDLVFDVALYGENANLRALAPKWRASLLQGAALYRQAMVAADRTIGSTALLARLMAEASGKPALVVRNALDGETLGAAAVARANLVPRGDGTIVIAYGSGTKTHDADFAVAAPAIKRLMREDARLRLRLMGELALDPGFDGFADRIERVPFTGFKAYLALLAAADIAIAPLERTVFNDAKSNIKLIEASAVGVPSVCSPAAEFAGAVTDGVDGFLAADEAAWVAALRRLAADPALRRAMGARAMARVLAEYDPARIAARETAPLLAGAATLRRRPLRVLVVNVFFAPRSFGGATIVAEEMTQHLAARDDTEVFVFTTSARDGSVPHELVRYRACGAEVIAARMPFHADHIIAFDDPAMGERFDDVLRAVTPDVVHFHAMQNLGAALTRTCQLRAVPYVVTLHDAWWLCERQFMVRADNVYCHQTAIDLKVCERCIPGARHLGPRMDILLQSLHAAALLLSPSASHAALYLANGFPPARMRVNRNGVRRPAPAHPASSRPASSRPASLRGTGATGPLRFGFVGGNARLKGAAVIHAAFRSIARRDWTLVIVDNTRDLGFSSVAAEEWRLPGQVEIVPPYDADGLDAFFAGLDVLLFPSQWKESYGLTVREALLRDVWVIATDSGGAAEEIVEGVNGTVVPLGNDPAPLAAAIEATLDRAASIRTHVNPFKDVIATLEEQARELHAFLAEAARVSQVSGPAEQSSGRTP